ncbi:carbohydrate sulfotransferase 11-like [Anneissia japonica]|uniref:carbohydrate sulfotransferase 11-like n=1 Tax=Anneissia japonica TaxID=1529436 RepID=UPI0014258621|nr:carbohydrate sulfotransferase 11-like [Anneissia japonica]XP_033122165.1 carbohydrate sulfotransferase 11-like [Anneissia japonica]
MAKIASKFFVLLIAILIAYFWFMNWSSSFTPTMSKIQQLPETRVIVTLKQSNDSKTSEEIQSKREMTIDELMEKYSTINERRIDYTREMCHKHRSTIPKMKTLPKLLVNEKHKIVYCQTPKVGTVSWCKIFLTLSGYKIYSDVLKMTAPQVSAAWKKHVPLLSHYSIAKQKEIMSSYTKIMFVRNPLTRLLSAYNDKLVAKNASDYNLSSQRCLSRKILKNFRPGYTTKNYDPTFGEFIKMIVSKDNYISNIHWRNMLSVCYPCDIDYDVIGRFEDIENDSNYILNRVGADLKFPASTGFHFTNSSNFEKVKKSYANIPDSDLVSLYQKYQNDFLLFDYKVKMEFLI